MVTYFEGSHLFAVLLVEGYDDDDEDERVK